MRLETALKTRGVPVAYRPPFAIGCAPYIDERPQGETILEIVRAVPDLPAAFFKRGVVCINGEAVPRALWGHVRPKPASSELAIAVTLHWPLGGGGAGGGSTAKAIGSLVAAFALVIITGGIAAGGAASLLGGLGIGSFAAGSTSAAVLAGAVGIAGALAISALSPPPTAGGTNALAGTTSDNNTDQKEAAAASGNVLDRGGAIPRVVGTRKVFPPLAGEPIVELVGDDEFVEALFPLNGPHALADIRIDNVAIAEADDVEFETREGWEDDAELNLVRRQGRTLTPQIELSIHKVSSASQNLLLDAAGPLDDLPVWHGVTARNEPDEIWLHLLLPSGISINGSTSTDIGIPLRLRMRQRGASAWINLPEIHLSGSTLQQLRRAILFKWKAPEPTQAVPTSGGFVYANVGPNVQTLSTSNPASPSAWLADGFFINSGGSRNDLTNGDESITKVQNLNLFANRVEIYLNETSFPKGIYEFQIMRGAAYARSSFSASAYTYGGNVVDFFYYQSISSPQIPMSRANLADRILVNRLVSIWNDYPVKRTGFALIALRARNRNLQNVSVSASGYVKDWDVSGWTAWTTTSNPAPHYADVLSGAQNIDPLPADLRDDTGLVVWRTLCNTYDWTCDAIINDTRTQDVLTLLASTGYARPYQSDVYGVIVDKDRSADTPVQIFSRRNAANVRYERAFARVPAGFIVTYRDNAADDDQAQQVVYQTDGALADATLLESITYDGLVDQAKVEVRARFDLDQANLRGTFYYLETDIESIVCRRGDLIGLEHDILSDRAGDGYIVSKTLSGSPPQITALVLDADIPITNVADMHATADMHAVADMHDVGVTTGIVIRRNDGTLSTHTLSNATGSSATLTLAAPFDDTSAIEGFADTNREYGCLVVAGSLTSIYRRLLVQSIAPAKDLKATLSLVDEAPALARYNPASPP